MRNIPIMLKSKDELSLIKQYLHLTKCVHGLTNAEIDVAAVVVRNAKKENGNLKKVLDKEGRAYLRDELCISETSFNASMFRLRKKGVLTKTKLSKLFSVLSYDNEGCTINFKLMLDAKES